MHKYEWDFDFKEIPKFVDKPDVTVDDLIRFDEKRLFPGVLAQLKYLEVPYLRHSLGEPDMSREAKGLYHQTLTTIRQDVSYDKRLFELTYPQKIKLLCHLRQWYKENPNEDNAQENLNSLIEAHFEYVEKDGEAK